MNIIKIIIALILVSTLGTIFFLKDSLIPQSSLVHHYEQTVRCFIADHYGLSIVIFMALYLTVVVLMLPLTVPVTVLAGYFFDPWIGTAMIVITYCIGSFLNYMVVRWLIQHKRYKKSRLLQSLEKKCQQYGVLYLVVLQLIPAFPLALINTVAVLSKMSIPLFFFLTMITMTPLTLLYAYGGSQLRSYQTSAVAISPSSIGMVIVVLGIILCIVWFLRSRPPNEKSY